MAAPKKSKTPRITSPTQPYPKPVAPTTKNPLPAQASARAKQVQAAHAAGTSPRRSPPVSIPKDAFARTMAAGAARKKK